jgi:[ribosomal protein S18]-alanine N-acetyltransferase
MTFKGSVRPARNSDLDEIVDLYLECFPQRAREVFGDGDKRTFIRDYLGFYLAWDPGGNWVYTEGGHVLGFIIAPCRYSPWRAALIRGQVLRWAVHFLTGKYGFPVHIVRRFLSAGFAFNPDPQVRQMWGKPFVHGIAVADRVRRQGVASELVQRALQEHRKKGDRFCFAVLRPGNVQTISLLEKAGFKVSHLSPEGEPIMILEAIEDDRLRHPQR